MYATNRFRNILETVSMQQFNQTLFELSYKIKSFIDKRGM
jgi:hypothetical protein